METAWRVLANDNPVVVIDGSGGAADFLSTCSCCYQRATRYTQLYSFFLHLLLFFVVVFCEQLPLSCQLYVPNNPIHVSVFSTHFQ